MYKGDRKSLVDKDGQAISLSILFCALANGDTARDLKVRFNLSRKSISYVRGAFIAANPEFIDRVQRVSKKQIIGAYRPQEKQLRFLVDECVSPAITYYVSRYLGWATHISFEGMNGTKDPEVDRHLVKAEFDAIFTMDRARNKGADLVNGRGEIEDLTDLAFARAIQARHAERKGNGYQEDVRFHSPVVIRIEGRKDWDNVRQRIRKYTSELEEAIRQRISPLIILTPKGVVYGPTYQDIFHEAKKPSDKDLFLKKKEEVSPERWLVDKWLDNAAKSNGRPLSRKQRRKIRNKCLNYLNGDSQPFTTTPSV
ncbi:MAG: hypothetical protein HRT94_06255 [Alphaproteobacteria bacterium]|nr:hypothetical protein [Alphaproteobacteria bacterium]